MPRSARVTAGGYCYHVINRGHATAEVVHKDEDPGAFVGNMGDACIRVPMRKQRRVGSVYATLSPSEIGRYA